MKVAGLAPATSDPQEPARSSPDVRGPAAPAATLPKGTVTGGGTWESRSGAGLALPRTRTGQGLQALSLDLVSLEVRSWLDHLEKALRPGLLLGGPAGSHRLSTPCHGVPDIEWESVCHADTPAAPFNPTRPGARGTAGPTLPHRGHYSGSNSPAPAKGPRGHGAPSRGGLGLGLRGAWRSSCRNRCRCGSLEGNSEGPGRRRPRARLGQAGCWAARGCPQPRAGTGRGHGAGNVRQRTRS